jgi:methyl-accepting chemotaxis protein
VLAEVLTGIRESVELVGAASAGIEEGAGRSRSLGESLRGLSGIVRENLGAARDIAGTVAGQVAGVGQLSSAFQDLTSMMEETQRTVRTTDEAAALLREVSEQVGSAVKAFRV